METLAVHCHGQTAMLPIVRFSYNAVRFEGHYYLVIAERYCPDPPVPVENGGLYDWRENMAGVTPYDTIVTYTCDIARQFLNASIENYTSVYDTVYPIQKRRCEWNQTWTPYEEVVI